MMAPMIYHAKGAPHGGADLTAAQDVVERALRAACAVKNVNFDSRFYDRGAFTQLLQQAAPNSVIYYDGHGTPDGAIVLTDGQFSGDEIRMHRASAPVLLHCCYSVKIATADFTDLVNVRNKIAILLSYRPGNGGNVREEVDRVMEQIEQEHPVMVDSADLSSRMAALICATGGIDRFSALWSGICPLSIGQFAVANDAAVTNAVAAAIGLLHFA
jgi:hypothetical protein